MNLDDLINDMDLPFSNPNEELETISKNRLCPMFDVERFQIRSETHDKGIDLSVELKNSGKHTNFRANIQLKATQKIKTNQDGSLSLQLDTSNINYLLNGGHPAFYILYDKRIDKFLYEYLNDFVQALESKDEEWHKQDSHVLRLYKELDKNAIEIIHDTIARMGHLSRKINPKLRIGSSTFSENGKILLDNDLNLTDDVTIRKYIEDYGIYLLNEGRWVEILDNHSKASQTVGVSSKYNLIVGMAYYYTGNLIHSLSHLKISWKQKSELDGSLQSHLEYFITIIKYTVGMISEEVYNARIKELESVDHLFLPIKLDNAKEELLNSKGIDLDELHNKFEQEINDIINHPSAYPKIKHLANCELILYRGHKISAEFAEGCINLEKIEILTGFNPAERNRFSKETFERLNEWDAFADEQSKVAYESGNKSAYYVAQLNRIKVRYTRRVQLNAFRNFFEYSEETEKQITEELLSNLVIIYNYFKMTRHISNVLYALTLKYEILHFANRADEYKNALKEIESIIYDYYDDVTPAKEKFEHLKNQGTTHEKFVEWRKAVEVNFNEATKEFFRMHEDIKRMNEEEKSKSLQGEKHIINLFPIGYFSFPKSELETMLQILGITDNELKELFQNRFGMIIPIANILNNPIRQEGPANGIADDNGKDSWSNVYRIRKAFYEKGFYKVSLPNP